MAMEREREKRREGEIRTAARDLEHSRVGCGLQVVRAGIVG